MPLRSSPKLLDDRRAGPRSFRLVSEFWRGSSRAVSVAKVTIRVRGSATVWRRFADFRRARRLRRSAGPRIGQRASLGRGNALKPVYALNMQEMAGLYPDLAAFRTSLGSERAACREPQPGLHLEVFAGLMEIAIQRQHLGAAR